MKQEIEAPDNSYVNMRPQPVLSEFVVCKCRSGMPHLGIKQAAVPKPCGAEMYSPIYVYTRNGGYMVEKSR